MASVCTKCSREVQVPARFCPYCGTQLAEQASDSPEDCGKQGLPIRLVLAVTRAVKGAVQGYCAAAAERKAASEEKRRDEQQISTAINGLTSTMSLIASLAVLIGIAYFVPIRKCSICGGIGTFVLRCHDCGGDGQQTIMDIVRVELKH